MNTRLFIERQHGYDIEANELRHDIALTLGLHLSSLRYLIIYDIFDISSPLLEQGLYQVFMEQNKDLRLDSVPDGSHVIAYESLPGQFDQRSNSAIECLRLIDPSTSVDVRSGQMIMFTEELSEEDITRVQDYLINAVESKPKDLSVLRRPSVTAPDDVKDIDNFVSLDTSRLQELHQEMSLAMSMEDLEFIQSYFKEELRNPTETELRVLDTYWSDHCRHTTFETEIKDVSFEPSSMADIIERSFQSYMSTRESLKRTNKPITLMDLATINAKLEHHLGNLDDLELSEEVNAASIYIDVDIDGTTEKWLLMFKNETHNHPTEIEPFGGASTCIGGAIRDPLSGRSYVYSAMRVTGAADITESYEDTLPGKLPQRAISKGAAQGYSSYGNQIGLATTFVEEIHHPGYQAKRMEIGAVIGAAPIQHVRRERPVPGDIIILLGGKTGRDGIGGATGSSKEHTVESIDESSAEVQKGNAPEERKIQRLFRNPSVTKLIKKSNDFGAGGVSVAVGELADSLDINLDAVPTKYQGINGTELAISESQERMAVVLDKNDVDTFIKYCHEENIEAVIIATVTNTNRLVMRWRNQIICDLKRSFIDTSGVRQQVTIHVPKQELDTILSNTFQGTTQREQIHAMLRDSNVASKQGMEEMFDSSIGRTTVFAPYGGKYKKTKTQVSCQLIPTRKEQTNTVSLMAYGFNPYLSEQSPYHGSMYAILDSMAKIVASGGKHQNIRFTFQEYYQKLYKDPTLWAKPFQALLGAYQTLQHFHLAAIGGKDSMSGTYHDIHVPPTLVSFAVTTTDKRKIISPEWKQKDSYIYLFGYPTDDTNLPDLDIIEEQFNDIEQRIEHGIILSAYAVGYGGLAESIIKPSFGNRIGINVETELDLFDYRYGAILVESTQPLERDHVHFIGRTTSEPIIRIKDETYTIESLVESHQSTYQTVYPITTKSTFTEPIEPIKETVPFLDTHPYVEDVRVLIPVFPGTNCEYDSEDAFRLAGASTKIVVFNNQTQADIDRSIQLLVEEIKQSHIIMLSGGFSSGDEPDGSGKFIANVLQQETIAKAIEEHLVQKRLILGICNGFQALVKSGLLPYGTITPISSDSPTLFKNTINRHIATFVNTKVSSLHSPWLTGFSLTDVHAIPVSHGEGRFIVSNKQYQELKKNHQIAFQYSNDDGIVSNDPTVNINGSSYAIEGIVSKDGLILGKMGHSERYQPGLFQNIHGNKQQDIFTHAIRYFKGGQHETTI